MSKFELSKKTLLVIDNFSKFLSSERANVKKMRLTPNYFEFKISEIIGFFDASNEGNDGFNEMVITDPKKFLDIVAKFGLKDASFQEPFLMLKKGNEKIKYHTSVSSGIKPVDRRIVDKFNLAIENNTLSIKPFDLDLNSLNNFFSTSLSLSYDHIKIEPKTNNIKLIAIDSSGIDAGYYEESLNIKTDEKFSITFNRDIISKVLKGRYRLYLLDEIVKLKSIDIDGLEYYLSVVNN